MTRPIAKPAIVSARPRRRQGTSALFRTALVFALAFTCVLSAPVVLAALHVKPPGLGMGGGDPESGQGIVPGLAPGACMAFAPPGGRSAKTVFIDPGHGGLDPGVVGTNGTQAVLEKTVTLSVARRLERLLRADGYRVVLSRTADTSVVKLRDSDSVDGAMTDSAVHNDLLARIACANASSAAALVSIHFDAFDDPGVAGSETFYDAARSFTGANQRLATDLQSALVAGVGMTDRGVWSDDGVGTALTARGNQYSHLVLLGPAATGWVDDPTSMPGALVEPLFLTNPTDARLAADPAVQQRMADALRQGLEKFLST